MWMVYNAYPSVRPDVAWVYIWSVISVQFLLVPIETHSCMQLRVALVTSQLLTIYSFAALLALQFLLLAKAMQLSLRIRLHAAPWL